ncbi:MAG: hypothetical protein AB7O97_05460 [Planctomycetota bacterium]
MLLRSALCLFTALLAGCATHGIRVPVMRPAPVNLVQFERVAVDRFEGDGCEPFSDELAEALGAAENPLNGRTAFQVLHRAQIDRAIDDLRGRRSDAADQEMMELLQRWRTAQIVLSGFVEDHGVQEEIVDELVKARDGTQHPVRVRRTAARVCVQLRATDFDGGRVFDEVQLRGAASAQTRAEDGEPAPIDPIRLLAAARAQAVQSYLQRVLPHRVYVEVALYTDGDVPDLQVGNGYAEAGNWPLAAESYRRALDAMTGELAEVRYKALFNLGVAHEFLDQFDDARKSLQEAYAIGQERMILDEIRRVEQREQEVRRLREQAGDPAGPAR